MLALNKHRVAILLTTALAWALSGCSGEDAHPNATPFSYPLDDTLRLNHIQAKGTHNSYHVRPEGYVHPDWDYDHLPLDRQLAELGVRKFELDVRRDLTLDAYEVYHLPVIDDVTTCRLFTDCLSTIEGWSSTYPLHHPVFVMLEPKSGVGADPEQDYAALEAEILSVFERERIITPDDVQGDASTLREAVLERGWPTLGEVRGKVLFFINDTGKFRDGYTRDNTSLEGRLAFTEHEDTDPLAAMLIINNGQDPRIPVAAAAGFIIRSLPDGGAREGDRSEIDAALAGGSHLLSSDFPGPVEGVDYVLEMPGGTPSRCNPVSAPPECTSLAIEDPSVTGSP